MNDGRSDQQGISEEMATFTQTPELMKETIGWDGGLAKKLSGGGKTILFVEDEAFVRNVTSEVLRSAGYKVLIARSADEALVAYRESFGTVEFLLTDVILPGESGMTLAGRLRHEDPKLKVLFISGYAEHLGMCNCEGAECLAKPFSTIALLERIKQLFDRRLSWAAEQGPLRRACGNA